jgi:hypothetical protein
MMCEGVFEAPTRTSSSVWQEKNGLCASIQEAVTENEKKMADEEMTGIRLALRYPWTAGSSVYHQHSHKEASR